MNLLSRFEGCLLGLAVGDALGMPAEFLSREEVRRRYIVLDEMVDAWLPAGSITDDGMQALALAESLVAHGGFNADDFAARLLAWLRSHPPDVGIHTRRVLSLMDSGLDWREASAQVESRYAPETAGNGSLMRCAPIALRYYRDIPAVIEFSKEQSRVTHAHPLAQYACAFYNTALAYVLLGNSRESAIEQALAVLPDLPEAIRQVVQDAPTKTADTLSASGFVLDTLQCALWAFLRFDNLHDALVAVVNLGNDADTNGAVAGALLGAHYGVEAIPDKWANKLTEREQCLHLAQQLLPLAQ